jgi:hypothetical protein
MRENFLASLRKSNPGLPAQSPSLYRLNYPDYITFFHMMAAKIAIPEMPLYTQDFSPNLKNVLEKFINGSSYADDHNLITDP